VLSNTFISDFFLSAKPMDPLPVPKLFEKEELVIMNHEFVYEISNAFSDGVLFVILQ
jgi:hypothetical protein